MSRDTSSELAQDSCPYSEEYFEPVETSSPYIVNAALNISTAIMATFANALVLVAIRRSASIRLPSKLLLCGLALTDLAIGVLVQPPYAVFLIMKAKRADSVCLLAMTYGFTGSLLFSASMLTMTAISLDRYLALFSYLTYQQKVNARRVSLVLAFIWLFSIFYGYTALWYDYLAWLVITFLKMSMSFSVMSVVYITIYRRLRHGNQVQDQGQALPPHAGNTLSMARNRRIANTMISVYVLLIICYLPSVIATYVSFFAEYNVATECIYEFLHTLLFINSSLNPIVFCIRMPDIRSEVKKQLRKIVCQN